MQIVSLTTDFGLQDYYAAEMKAHILSKVQDVTFVDISHSIDSHDIVQAAHFLENVYRTFPTGTIHAVAVYNYYDWESKMIAFSQNGHYFVGPDNGVFSLVFDTLGIESKVYYIENISESYNSVSKQIAYAVKHISSGLPLDEIGSEAHAVCRKMGIRPVVTGTQIRATIIHIDHYENVIINLQKDQFEKVCNDRSFELFYKQNDPIKEVSMTYSDVPIGDVLCLFNDAGFMEIAINMGKAASQLNLNKNETVQINFI